jgi:hypothetical protein
MPKIDPQTIARLRELLVEYEQEVKESNYAVNWQPQMVRVSRQFVDWLADEFDPADHPGQ